MNIIATIDQKRGLDHVFDNVPEYADLFSYITKDCAVIMGRKTYEKYAAHASLLTNCISFIVTSNPMEYTSTEDTFFVSMQMLEENIIPNMKRKLFIVGGKSLYDKYIEDPRVKNMYITEVKFPNNVSDTLFPLISSKYEIMETSSFMKSESGLSFTHIHYKKTNTVHETPYLDMAQYIFTHGEERMDRTNIGTWSIFGEQITFHLGQRFPLLTTKKVAWKTCVKELLWFLKGDTSAKRLQEQGVRIWNGNSSREFLDHVGLYHLEEGDCGANYSFQWRHFGAEYKNSECDYSGQGIDQIAEIESLLKTNPQSRRIFMSAWNPSDLCKTVLPPCHVSAQFYVHADNSLSCHMYQRSADWFLGVPFNIMSYATLTCLLAKRAGMTPGKLVMSFGDCHIYKNHLHQIQEQLSRHILASPILSIDDAVMHKNIEDICVEDFDVIGYFPHTPIQGAMAV